MPPAFWRSRFIRGSNVKTSSASLRQSAGPWANREARSRWRRRLRRDGQHHARNLHTLEDVDFVGVADSSRRRGNGPLPQDAARSFRSTISFVRALTRPSSAFSTAGHEEIALELIARSVAVLIEKPIAHTVRAGRRIIDAAANEAVPLMVGYVERYNPAVIAAKRFIEEGNLGSLISISAQRVGILPPRIKDANVLIDIGVHDVNAIAFVTGKPLKLFPRKAGARYWRTGSITHCWRWLPARRRPRW